MRDSLCLKQKSVRSGDAIIDRNRRFVLKILDFTYALRGQRDELIGQIRIHQNNKFKKCVSLCEKPISFSTKLFLFCVNSHKTSINDDYRFSFVLRKPSSTKPKFGLVFGERHLKLLCRAIAATSDSFKN